jgi:glycosyltransferase involved in cell wall biosynthesis
MGKNKKSTKEYPMVSVCTPTFNRRPFIENMFSCFRNQDYPTHRIEWIIVDDGSDKIKDLIETSNIPQIRYFEIEQKMSLGAKRNLMHQYATGSIIVYMDDDDYYPPERISHSVERLQENPDALCAGSSEIYIYFKGMDKMIQCGPYGPNHATAGTFAFKKELLEQTKYEDHAALAEERAFLKDYTIPFVQLDSLKTILVFSHEHNTFDKRKMFDQKQDPKFFKESGKVVSNFIRRKSEKNIKKFFLEDIDNLLKFYEPGLPKMKPDVMVQMKEIEAKREKMIQDAMEKQRENGPIILQQGEGKPPIQISNKQAVEIMKQQQEQIRKLTDHKNQNDKLNNLLKEKVSEQMKLIKALKEDLTTYKSEETKGNVEIIEKSPSFVQPVDGNGLSEGPINKSKPVVMVNTDTD